MAASIATPTARRTRRARRLANALKRLGVRMHDRVATLAWNGFRHYEVYYAVAGSGAVIHTINPRLFPDQIAYIANHAEDKIVFYDTTFSPLVEKLKSQVKASFIPLDQTSTKSCSPAKATISTGRRSTRRPRPASATPRAPPAIRRARCIRTARP